MNDNLVLAARKTKLLSGDKTNQVDAVIETDLPSNVLAELETQWSEGREAGKSRLECAGSSRQCQHSHWKWNCHQKMFGVANKQFRLLGVRMGTEWQGAMAICCKSQTTHTLPALYVEYIETAPWNYKPFVQPNSPRYHHLGSMLMQEAVRLSVEMGLQGCVGLSSLPIADSFYEHIGMTRLSEYRICDYICGYYEFTAEAAQSFLARGITGE